MSKEFDLSQYLDGNHGVYEEEVGLVTEWPGNWGVGLIPAQNQVIGGVGGVAQYTVMVQDLQGREYQAVRDILHPHGDKPWGFMTVDRRTGRVEKVVVPEVTPLTLYMGLVAPGLDGLIDYKGALDDGLLTIAEDRNFLRWLGRRYSNEYRLFEGYCRLAPSQKAFVVAQIRFRLIEFENRLKKS